MLGWPATSGVIQVLSGDSPDSHHLWRQASGGVARHHPKNLCRTVRPTKKERDLCPALLLPAMVVSDQPSSDFLTLVLPLGQPVVFWREAQVLAQVGLQPILPEAAFVFAGASEVLATAGMISA